MHKDRIDPFVLRTAYPDNRVEIAQEFANRNNEWPGNLLIAIGTALRLNERSIQTRGGAAASQPLAKRDFNQSRQLCSHCFAPTESCVLKWNVCNYCSRPQNRLVHMAQERHLWPPFTTDSGWCWTTPSPAAACYASGMAELCKKQSVSMRQRVTASQQCVTTRCDPCWEKDLRLPLTPCPLHRLRAPLLFGPAHLWDVYTTEGFYVVW